MRCRTVSIALRRPAEWVESTTSHYSAPLILGTLGRFISISWTGSFCFCVTLLSWFLFWSCKFPLKHLIGWQKQSWSRWKSPSDGEKGEIGALTGVEVSSDTLFLNFAFTIALFMRSGPKSDHWQVFCLYTMSLNINAVTRRYLFCGG